ncbi:hypothetical protein MA16_Dca021104 [Dendrobium catenatum]|uniref:DUF4283 domain-containing protein n=1 Tax=Dendrobium catenatum TaxID=906689 RepID=A0A2I0VQQ0_9ASPA|nr:hypothetical protein MA16_Dca021104 [Dendrobium catenatum]
MKIDFATSIGSRPSLAHVLVELDITKSYPDKVWLGPQKSSYVQQAVMEDFPPFCASCKSIGHVVGNCHPMADLSIPNKVSVTPELIISSPPIQSLLTVENFSNDVVVVDLDPADSLARNEDVLEGVPPAISNPYLAQVDFVVVGVVPVTQVPRLCVSDAVELNCGVNSKPTLSCVFSVPAPCGLAMVDVLCVVVGQSSSSVSPLRDLFGCGDPSLMVLVNRDDASSSVNLVLDKKVHAQSDLVSNDIFESNINFVYIPISVMSNVEMKDYVAKFVKNSVLVQTDWLILEDSIS